MPDVFALSKWNCSASRAPECPGICNTDNLAIDTHCAVCGAPKPKSIRQPTDRRTPPVDIEEFLARQFTTHSRHLAAGIDVVNGRTFLTLAAGLGDPVVYLVEHNALTPCDSYGRPSW